MTVVQPDSNASPCVGNGRRRLLQALASVAVAPLLVRAQAPASLPRVGLLVAGTSLGSTLLNRPFADVFNESMEEQGYVAGRNFVLAPRFGEGNPQRLREAAAELVRLPAAVIVALGPGPTEAARAATSTVPIVMGNADPVERGVIASFARPGGNITGWSFVSAEIAGKQMQLLREAIPSLSRIGILTNSNSSGDAARIAAIDAAGRIKGLRVQVLDVTHPEALEPAFAMASRSNVGAIIVLAEPQVLDGLRTQITALAARHRLPAMYLWRSYVESGGLMNYGPAFPPLIKRMAYFAARILKGAKPADLPVERPQQFEFVINMKAADALGLVLPHQLLISATEIVR